MTNIPFRIVQVILVLTGSALIIGGGSIFIIGAFADHKGGNEYSPISPAMFMGAGFVLMLLSAIPFLSLKALKPTHSPILYWIAAIISVAIVFSIIGPFLF